MLEPGLVQDLNELGNAIDDLEQQLANCSTREERDRIKAELQKLRGRLETELVAKVAEIRQMLDQLAEAKATAGDATLAEELRKAADRLTEMARRRREVSP